MYKEKRFDVLAIQEAENSRVTAKYKNVSIINVKENYVEFKDEIGKIHIITGNVAIFVDEHDDSQEK